MASTNRCFCHHLPRCVNMPKPFPVSQNEDHMLSVVATQPCQRGSINPCRLLPCLTLKYLSNISTNGKQHGSETGMGGGIFDLRMKSGGSRPLELQSVWFSLQSYLLFCQLPSEPLPVSIFCFSPICCGRRSSTACAPVFKWLFCTLHLLLFLSVCLNIPSNCLCAR